MVMALTARHRFYRVRVLHQYKFEVMSTVFTVPSAPGIYYLHFHLLFQMISIIYPYGQHHKNIVLVPSHLQNRPSTKDLASPTISLLSSF